MLTRIVGKRDRRPSLEELDHRRAMERDIVASYESPIADTWYLVDAEWHAKWERFVSQGGSLPGHVTNEVLVNPRSGQPELGLRYGAHYLGVNAAVWSYFEAQHGGGPVIVRRLLDIYSTPVNRPSQADSLLAVDDDDELQIGAACSGGGRLRSGGAVSQGGFFQAFRRRVTPRSTSTRRSSCATEGTIQAQTCSENKENNCIADSNGSDSAGLTFFVMKADVRVVAQPQDGSCLFHALSNGLDDGACASKLRLEISHFILTNQNVPIAGTTLKDWVQYDSSKPVSEYATKMADSSWGGGIEMRAFAQLKGISVYVFEAYADGYRRISCFDACSEGARTINILYEGRNHYDLMEIRNGHGSWVDMGNIKASV